MKSSRYWTCVALALALSNGVARSQSTARVSVDSSGAQGDMVSAFPSISADGRFVAFQSTSTNLVAGDTNDAYDVFVHDRVTGITERVSVGTGGGEGDQDSFFPSISADGRFVAFQSFASTLAPGATNGGFEIYVRDRQLGTTERVSVGVGGAPASSYSYAPSISADGRFVAFASNASNLVVGDTNAVSDVFVRDRQTGTTERVSLDSGGFEANGASELPSISADGRFVSFTSVASLLVSSDTNGVSDVFLRDRQAGTTERVSVGPSGAQGNAASYSYATSISADGRFVGFTSVASNLVTGDTNGFADVFARDRLSGITERVSVGAGGLQANLSSEAPAISSDGRFVAFVSNASNLVPGDTNGSGDAFVLDRQSGTLERVSVSTSGTQGSLPSRYPSISADGRHVAFESEATNLVAGDTNGVPDVFVRERSPAGFTILCDPSQPGVSACPCGNTGAPGHGCASSVNAAGARLAPTGTASVSNDTLALVGSGMPNSSCLYFQGTAQAAGGAGVAFGDGLRCAGGTITRLGTKTNAAGASQYPTAGDPSISLRGSDSAGDVRTYQAWYRNAAPAFCTPSTFNLTNGLELTWTP